MPLSTPPNYTQPGSLIAARGAPQKGTRPFGGNTRATRRTFTAEVAATVQETETIVKERVALILKDQTGYGGFKFYNMGVSSGTTSGTAKQMQVYDQDGTVGYVNVYPSRS
jgi:hypothetical protein